jgi:hypothetical protein
MVVGDDCANEVIVSLYKDGSKVYLSTNTAVNAIGGYIVHDNGNTIEISGEVTSDGDAKIVMPSAAYLEPGVIMVTVRLFAEPAQIVNGLGDGWAYKATIASFKCEVKSASTQTIVVPSLKVADGQTLIQYIDMLIAAISQANPDTYQSPVRFTEMNIASYNADSEELVIDYRVFGSET